jgi:enoyl-CoA hydratase
MTRSHKTVARSHPGDGRVAVTERHGWVEARLERPSRGNRVNAAMSDELMALFERVEDDDSVRALAISGAGSAFCEGFEPGVDANLVESFAVVSKPTVAILNGGARDEGLELAIAADIRVAIRGARLALTQPERGSMPRFGATQRLPRLCGIGNALRMLLAGTEIDGQEAARIGLVTYLAANRRELDRRAGEVAEAILTRAPLAAKLVKEAVRKGYDMTLDQGIRLEEDLYALLQTTADRAEGVRAFLEKRKPLFKGA